MKIYTLTGDDGSTSLSGGKRVPKHSSRVEAYGSVDELIAWIGLLRVLHENSARRNILVNIQDNLMRCATALALEKPEESWPFPDEGSIISLEREIDKMDEELPVLKNFILPGGNLAISYCHIARCVCRRAERAVLRLKRKEPVPDILHKFLNRLSDYLFVLSRKISYESGSEEVIWHIPK